MHADLRASNDEDPQFASTGRFGLGKWLINGAASTWQRPTAEETDFLERLLPHSGLTRDARRVVAFRAGLTPEPDPVPDTAEPHQAPDGPLSLRDRVARAWQTRR